MHQPTEPKELHPLAREILVELQAHSEASQIVIGGGVALQHYCEYRSTVDLDAWWAVDADGNAEEAITQVLGEISLQHGLELSVRKWRETTSYDLGPPQGAKQFSFQISRRSKQLSPPLESAWPPIKIEAFVDNLGAKMNALVDRGAPRDLLDVHEVCRRGLSTIDKCWDLWLAKQSEANVDDARLSVLHHLAALESRRPLERIIDMKERDSARSVREWVRNTLCARGD